jgi:hypothetical protein
MESQSSLFSLVLEGMYPKMAQDIKRGEVFENYVESYFKRRGWSVKRAKGNTPAYDMVLTRGTSSIYVECKYDLMSDKTGNYCLEFASLQHTQSTVLVIGTPNEAYALSMDEARKLFNQYPHRQVGDIFTNMGALVPKIIFQTNYQRL